MLCNVKQSIALVVDRALSPEQQFSYFSKAFSPKEEIPGITSHSIETYIIIRTILGTKQYFGRFHEAVIPKEEMPHIMAGFIKPYQIITTVCSAIASVHDMVPVIGL